MKYKEFKEWAEGHKYFSYVLIILFCLGIGGQVLDYWQKLVDIIKPNNYFEIIKYEISIENSVYYEWDKLPNNSKMNARKTQFNDNKYRQFRYDENYIDNFGVSPGRGFLTAIFMIQYAYAKLDLQKDVKEELSRYAKDYIFWTQKDKDEFKDYVYELVPKKRFVYENGTDKLVNFFQGSEPKHLALINAMHSFRNNPKPFNFSFNGKAIKNSTVENLVLEHIALFTGAFLPVFEVYVKNPTKSSLTIDKVAAEVIEIAEYRGGAESVPTSKIITIPVAYRVGMNERKLVGSEEVYLKPGADIKILLRLEPREKLSSYLIKLHIYAGAIHRATDTFALDM